MWVCGRRISQWIIIFGAEKLDDEKTNGQSRRHYCCCASPGACIIVTVFFFLTHARRVREEIIHEPKNNIVPLVEVLDKRYFCLESSQADKSFFIALCWLDEVKNRLIVLVLLLLLLRCPVMSGVYVLYPLIKGWPPQRCQRNISQGSRL
jgi:hypothetical protein